MDFLYTFKGTKNLYLDTALASHDTVMGFIEYEIERGRTFGGSDVPFETMKWELEKVFSLPIGGQLNKWILSKNPREQIR